MDRKRPYTHILKNLLHEQIDEIFPLLRPGYWIEETFTVELPELRTLGEEPATEFDKGLAGLAMPGATVISRIRTEWIENSGKFERGYRVHMPETKKPCYMAIEFQMEREDDDVAGRLLTTLLRVISYAREHVEQEDVEDEEEQEGEEEQKGTVMNKGYYILPEVLCPFSQSVPAPIDTGSLKFNFMTIALWERDAREVLNTHVSAAYFLLPTMKNADANLLGLAIEELAQRFKGNDTELGRHLSGMNLMLQQSEMMSDEEKLAAQEHLKPFMHLIKTDPYEEQ
jgi:hypothetical protein